jgi:hypothetical protein
MVNVVVAFISEVGMSSGELNCRFGSLSVFVASGISGFSGRILLSVDTNATRTGVSMVSHHFDRNSSRTRCQRRWPSSGNLLNHFLAGDPRCNQLEKISTFSRLIIDGWIFASIMESQFEAFSAASGMPVK